MRNHFLAQSSLIAVVVATGLLAASSAGAADPVYMWKDANGQSHYSQQVPDGVKVYKTITPSGAAAASGDADAAASHSGDAASTAKDTTAGLTTAQIERQKLCDSARKNVDTLSTRPIVQMDINNTGKPVTLTPDQQTQQLSEARQQASSFCAK